MRGNESCVRARGVGLRGIACCVVCAGVLTSSVKPSECWVAQSQEIYAGGVLVKVPLGARVSMDGVRGRTVCSMLPEHSGRQTYSVLVCVGREFSLTINISDSQFATSS